MFKGALSLPAKRSTPPDVQLRQHYLLAFLLFAFRRTNAMMVPDQLHIAYARWNLTLIEFDLLFIANSLHGYCAGPKFKCTAALCVILRCLYSAEGVVSTEGAVSDQNQVTLVYFLALETSAVRSGVESESPRARILVIVVNACVQSFIRLMLGCA